MGERKVLNKYYPPDFDPREVPKKLTPRHFKQITIRTMLPMSIRCSTCGEFVYMGRKFNARQERAPEHDYLGIRVFRQYIRCPSCKCEIIFRTDPKNSDYVLEAGATRNFEPWKQKAAVEAIVQEERDREDREDSMKALENRTLESKREMDQLDALEEIRELNRAQAKGDASDRALERLRKQAEEAQRREQQLLEAEVEEQAKKLFGEEGDTSSFVRRIPQQSSLDAGLDSDPDSDAATKHSLFNVSGPAAARNRIGSDAAAPQPLPGLVVVNSQPKKKKQKKKSKNKKRESGERKKRKLEAEDESKLSKADPSSETSDGTNTASRKKPRLLVAYDSSSSDSEF